MRVSRSFAIAAGAIIAALTGVASAVPSAGGLATQLDQQARRAIANAGGHTVKAHFTTYHGWASRHPFLTGGDGISDATRGRVARGVARIHGVGAVKWADGTRRASLPEELPQPLLCQRNVETLLRGHNIRFAESSAQIDPTSLILLDEVAVALRPCQGSLIAVSGHTDSSGPETANLALSRTRANAVRKALIHRGIPANSLRAVGAGSSEPIAGLDPSNPANRRIEFSVIAIVPIHPTPVDEAGPR